MHIRAARGSRSPLVVHVLRAHDLAPRVLREERAHEVGGVMHSYSGGADLVPVYRDLGFAFSFAGPVTYANARRPLEAVRAVPAELLLVETDAPDQAPAKHRGGRLRARVRRRDRGGDRGRDRARRTLQRSRPRTRGGSSGGRCRCNSRRDHACVGDLHVYT